MVSECMLKPESFFSQAPVQRDSRKTSGNSIQDFGNCMETAVSSVDKAASPEAAKTADAAQPETDYEKEVYSKALKSVVKDKIQQDQDSLSADAAAVGYISQIVDLICEKFSMSEEDLNNLMQENNIGKEDLLTNDGLMELLTKLSPQQDIFSLLTDPEISNSLKEIFNFAKEAKNQLLTQYGISEQEIGEFLKNAGMNAQPLEKQENQQEMQISGKVLEDEPAVTLDTAAKQQSGKIPVQVTVQENGPQDTAKVTADTGSGQKEAITLSEQTGESSSRSSSQEGETHAGDFIQILTGKVSEIIQEVDESVDAAKIIKQIVEQVKLTVTQDSGKIEMQLYPEHLGKISLEITAKNGMVTAQIAAQSLAVKEAIESNLPLLKENLENQGLKVESVEVTIAAREFEQNLNDGSGQQDNQPGKKKRFINFENIDNQIAEDALEQEIMQMEGNKVSLRA